MAASANNETQRSLNDLHNTTGEIRQSLGRVEGQLGTFIKQMEVQDERHITLEDRMRKVEGRQHFVSGAYGLAALFLNFIGIKIFGAH